MSSSINSAINSYKRIGDQFAITICENQLSLMKYQRSLEEKFNKNFRNLTLHETLVKLLEMNEVELANKLHSEFKVPERR